MFIFSGKERKKFYDVMGKMGMKWKEKAAKIIRTVTVPPVLATAMMLTGYFVCGEQFAGIWSLLLNIFLLAVVPVLAYPIASLKPGTAKDLRERQRKLAFGLNLLGYTAALILGVLFHSSGTLMRVLGAYFLAVLLLTVLNKFLKIRASGHACSCVLPYLFISFWTKGAAAGICIILYILEFWASVFLKRHTVREFLTGSAVAAAVFVCMNMG